MDNSQLIATLDDLNKRLTSVETQRINQQQILPSAVQARHLAGSPQVAAGSLLYQDANNNFVNIPIGTVGQVLTQAGGVPAWSTPATPTLPVDGWTAVTDSWAYASATTITVPSGAASLYQKGDRIKLTQTTVKYFVITGVASTVLTITGGSDYTLANAAITLPSYSHNLNPLGFPGYFNYTPTLSATGSMTFGTTTITYARFSIDGTKVFYEIDVSGTTGGSTSTEITFTVPITMNGGYSTTFSLPAAAVEVSDSGSKAGMLTWVGATTLGVRKYDASNWGIGANKTFSVSGFYQMV